MPSIKNKEVEIDKIKVIQAPLAGISDKVFRALIRKYHSNCLMTTEMISSEMLCNNPNPRIIEFEEFEYPLSFQLVGHKIDKMTTASKIIAPYASVIDINCGCPVKKVVVSGDGSAMMKTPKLAGDIIKSIKDETGLPVSAKFRLGWSAGEENYIEFALHLQEAGVDFVTLHARTRSQMYQGKADWEKIGLLKRELKIPVFANGDITTIEDAVNCLNITKCDGIAIGRGIMGDFTLPYRIERYLSDGLIIKEPDLKEKIEMLKLHLKNEVEFMGEKNGVKFMRKFYNYYISSVKNASKYRSKLVLLGMKKKFQRFWMKYYLYIIKTIDNTLYCGIALDVLKRFDEHLNSKKGAKYTKAHKPESLVYVDCFEDKSSALKEEIRIKKLKKAEKLKLIEKNKAKTEKFLKIFHETLDKIVLK